MRVQRVKEALDVGVVRPDGPIDARNVEALRTAVEGARGRGVRAVVLDLTEVRYINSLGLSALINLSDAMAFDGGELLLAAAAPKVKIVYELMGLEAVLPLHRSVRAAAAAAVRRSLSRGRA